MNKLISLFLILGVGHGVWAQSTPKASVMKPENKSSRVHITFENELVSGKADNPDTSLIQLRKNPNFKKLIKLRENFNPEMDRSKNVFQK